MEGLLILFGLGIFICLALSWLAQWASKKYFKKTCSECGGHDWGTSTQKIGNMTWRKCQRCGHEQVWHDGPKL
jgi:hypothetical protein